MPAHQPLLNRNLCLTGGLLSLSLLLFFPTLATALPTGEYARIVFKNKVQLFHEPLALFSPQPLERSKSDGPKDLPVLAFYFFREHLSSEEKVDFAGAIAANSHGAEPAYPYSMLELGILPEAPLSPSNVGVFNVGRCLNEKSYSVTGANLNDPAQLAQWKVEFSNLSGELKEGAKLQLEISLEHRASRYLAEFRVTAPLMLVSQSCYQVK